MKCRRFYLACVLLLIGFAGTAAAAPKIDPALAQRVAATPATSQLGVILTFHGDYVTDQQAAAISALGVRTGIRMANFPIVAVNATPSQIRQMMGWPSLRSIYLNAPLELYLNQTKPLIGVDRLRTDSDITRRNGGTPVSGRGVTIAINDTGIDGTHPDVAYDPIRPSESKTIQNVIVSMSDRDGLLVRSDTLGNVVEGILPPAYIENVINSDTHGGHGTHVASTAAGTGVASGGLYQGVAPGASLLGLGSGAGVFVVGQIASFDYCLSNQFRYNVRIVNNSWGNSAVAVDADHPINVASKRLHDAGIVVIFANGNDGPDPSSQNRWASVPWVISVGAATKDGRLAGFSSRGIFQDATVHPTIITPGTGGPSSKGFTSAVVAARARINPAANGFNADTQIPPGFLPNYTQISGTSMAAPHLAGVVASMLSANPALTPDDVKVILERTATPFATYDEFEVGAGMANVHAAVDLALNPGKGYGDFGFTGKGLTLVKQDAGTIHSTLAPGASQTHAISVPRNARFTFVQLDWGGGANAEEEIVIDNTNLVASDLALTILRDGQTVASSDDINLGGLFGVREAVKLEFPAEGTLTARVEAGLIGQGVVTDQPYTLVVRHYVFDSNQVGDLAALDTETQVKVYRLIYDRIMAADGGSFRPDAQLNRIEMARALMFGARVPQFLPNRRSFGDIAQGSADELIVESLKREGVIGLDGMSFVPTASVTRLEQAVALVRALRLDAQARSLAGTTVITGNQPLADNNEIPPALRGYVQIALDRGLMQATPAESGQGIGITGAQAPTGAQMPITTLPRFLPNQITNRVEFADSLTRLISEMFGE